MGRGRGMGRGMGVGKGMGIGRAGTYPQRTYPDPSSFQQSSTESMNPEQELAMLKEQAKTIETQLHEINARISALEEGRSVSALMAEVDAEKCTGCFRCSSACPTGAISMFEGIAKIDQSKCTGCGECILLCPDSAIVLKKA
jgi:ferredoxin